MAAPPEDRHRREARWQALAAAAAALAAVAAWWAAAPTLAATEYWTEHFPWADPRAPIPFFALFFVLGVAAQGVWPGTWEGLLLARSLRAIGWTVLLYWAFAIVLEAPAGAALAVLPLLAAPPVTALRVARGAGGRIRPYLATLVMLAGAAGLVALVTVPMSWLARLIVLPAPVAAYSLVPALLLRTERDATTAAQNDRHNARTPTHPLDLPVGTLVPPASIFPVLAGIAWILFVVLVVAPGVPLGGPIAWLGLTLSIPIVAWSTLRRSGVAHPRRVVAPPEARVHAARVAHIKDEELARLDDAVLRFVRSGRGRRELATVLDGLIGPAIPDVDADRLDRMLASLPRAPWRRRAREEGVARLVGGEGLLHAVRQQKRTPAPSGGSS